MKPLSYSITVSCLGHLIRDGHQLSHRFHWEDQQSFAIPANTSQSPICPQAYLQSLVRQTPEPQMCTDRLRNPIKMSISGETTQNPTE